MSFNAQDKTCMNKREKTDPGGAMTEKNVEARPSTSAIAGTRRRSLHLVGGGSALCGTRRGQKT